MSIKVKMSKNEKNLWDNVVFGIEHLMEDGGQYVVWIGEDGGLEFQYHCADCVAGNEHAHDDKASQRVLH